MLLETSVQKITLKKKGKITEFWDTTEKRVMRNEKAVHFRGFERENLFHQNLF